MQTALGLRTWRVQYAAALLALGLLLACGERPADDPWPPLPEERLSLGEQPSQVLARGRVVLGGRPVRGATVRYCWVDRGRVECATSYSDAAGQFAIEAYRARYVPPGTRGTLFASSDERAAFASRNGLEAGAPEPVELAGDDEPAVFRVRIVDAEGQGIDEAYVDLRPQVSADPVRFAPAARSYRGADLQIAAPTLPFRLEARALGFEPTAVGPVDSTAGPRALTVRMSRSEPDTESAFGTSSITRDVLGILVPPRGVALDALQLTVARHGRRGIARDGSFLLPDLPLGTHLVSIEERECDLAPGATSGREWDTTIVCHFGYSRPRVVPQGAFGFMVDVDDRPEPLRRHIDLDRPPRCMLAGRLVLDPLSEASEGECTAHLLDLGTRASIRMSPLAADGTFTIGLDEPRAVRLSMQMHGATESWWLETDVSLTPGRTEWTLALPTGGLDLEPAWIEGELQPPADRVLWSDSQGTHFESMSHHEVPITRHRHFHCVPAGTVELQRSDRTSGAVQTVGTAVVHAGRVTTVRLE